MSKPPDDPEMILTTEQELEHALFNVVMSLWKLKADKTQNKELASAFVVEILTRMQKAFQNQS